MAKQKKSWKGARAALPSDTITDPRFAAFSTDPRFRLPSKKNARTKVDKRFARMLKDDDFSNTATVDRPEDEDEDEESASEAKADVEVDDDDVVEKELRRAEGGYDPARGGGFSSSSEEEESDVEEDVEVDVEEGGAFPNLQAEQTEVPMGEVTRRIAVVNLDWDNIRAVDLYSVFSSFVSGSGRIENLAVYKSEYGKERMEREEMEGPPREIFARQKSDSDDEDEERDSEEDTEDEEERIKQDLLKPDNGEEFDSAALRQYQLERLRYYYAVVTFSDAQSAHRVYEATDGTEYLTSANFFDLRFVPDETEFDDVPRDECSAVPTGYKPADFVTDALQHSKVKLTWDADDASRKDTLNKAFSGSRAEIGENDLRAYLGSDSSEAESDGEAPEADDVPKLTKKEAARLKMRAALGLPDEPMKSKREEGPVGDMEITFAAGLSTTDKSEGVFLNKPIVEETTAEAYIRKEKERKARRKEKAKAAREGRDGAAEADADEAVVVQEEDLGFEDPFFATDEKVKAKAASDLRKQARAKKHAEKAAAEAAAAKQKEELELIMADGVDEGGAREHFDINEIARAEKAARRKGKLGRKGKKADEDRKGALQKGFEMDVQDPRFGALFENHEFAIDTSNPKYKATEGMKKLLEEGRRKRKGDEEGEGEEERGREKGGKKRRKGGEGKAEAGEELGKLVESVKKRLKK